MHMCLSADLYKAFLNIPSCKHTFNWVLFSQCSHLHLWQNLQPSRANDIRNIGVAGLLLIVGGVWGADRSDFFLPQSLQADSYTCAQTCKVKSQAVLLIMPEFIPRRNKLNCMLILHHKLSLSLPPQLSSWHQRSDPKVSQPREPWGISGTSV